MKITKEYTSKEITCRTGSFGGGASFFHWHENIEICRIISGEGNFLVDGSLMNLRQGDILAVGEQVVHQFLIDFPDTVIRICQLSPKTLLDRDAVVKPIQTHITAEEINSVSGLSERIEMLFDILQNDGGAEHTGDIPYIKSVAATLYFMLMHYFPGEPDTKTYKDRNFFYKIVEYVNSSFAEDITVQSIAEKFYVSRGKAGSVFLKYSGETLNQYINSIRIKNANMLMDSGLGVTESALESGFQNVRTFNEVYKKIMGITPSEYVKK